MVQIQANAMRMAFLLGADTVSGKAAQAAHSLIATLEGKVGTAIYAPAPYSRVNRQLDWANNALKAQFGLSAGDIRCKLGLSVAAEQVYKNPETHDFKSCAAYPELFGTSQASTYMLSVPVRYNGTYFHPVGGKLIAPNDFIPAGQGNIAIRGVGNVITPAILSVEDTLVALPSVFDADGHDWVLSPYPKQLECKPRTP